MNGWMNEEMNAWMAGETDACMNGWEGDDSEEPDSPRRGVLILKQLERSH